MSTAVEQVVSDILEHHGVKGMKWGVRRMERAGRKATEARAVAAADKAKWDAKRIARGKAPKELNKRKRITASQAEANAINSQRRADALTKKATKLQDKADKKWEQSIYSVQGAVAVHNATADHFNAHIDALNARHPEAHLDHPDTPETKAYIADVMKLENQGYAAAVKSVHGKSPSGRKKAVFVNDDNGPRIEVRDRNVTHADEEEPDLTFRVKINDRGQISEVNLAKSAEVAHAEAVERFLEHHGVKGMKWGVRKDRAPSGPTPVSVTQKKPGAKVKAEGGSGHPAHEDARNALAIRQKAKSSRMDSLSNDELQSAIKRMQLEQQFDQLSKNKQSAGKKFARKLIGETAGQQASSVVNTQAAYEIDKQLKKRGRPVAAKSKYKFKED